MKVSLRHPRLDTEKNRLNPNLDVSLPLQRPAARHGPALEGGTELQTPIICLLRGEDSLLGFKRWLPPSSPG
jgi:hypothetical protein